MAKLEGLSCPRCGAILISCSANREDEEIWDQVKKKYVKIKYKTYKHECIKCGKKLKELEDA
jgi:predicted RNA-binding Zn-ribbon protein involved in translation (DUF1610 family)